MIPKAKQVWIRQLDAARQAQITVIVEILGELDYLKPEAAELEPNLVAECVIRNVDLDGVIRDLEEAHDMVERVVGSGTTKVEMSEHGLIEKVSVEEAPTCPKCGSELVVRVVKNGPRAGSSFLGCVAYPSCMGTAPLSA
jgi:hypothetical protein